MSIDLSLDRIERLFSQFERFDVPTVHVAGTNGKGSVSALLTSIFLAASPPLVVGRFNSPHLIDVTDCITINDIAVSKNVFEAITHEVRDLNDSQNIQASGFEVLTVTALLIFKRSHVDIVICEVGMGGRLDATNVIPDDAILASVITSVDLDHQAFLGSTVTAIAREKAGIIRCNKPVILSPQVHKEVTGVVGDVASKEGAELFLAPKAVERTWDREIDGTAPPSFSISPFQPPGPCPVEVSFSSKQRPNERLRVLLPLHGEHQLANLGTALSAVHVLKSRPPTVASLSTSLASLGESAIRKAVLCCRWPGRLSFHIYKVIPKGSTTPSGRPLVILADGAHNEAASSMLSTYISSLLTALPSGGRKTTVNLSYILSLSHSPPKSPASVLEPLIHKLHGDQDGNFNFVVRFAALRFTPPAGMPWVKSVPPSIIQSSLNTVIDPAKGRNIEQGGSWTAPDAEVADAGPDLASALQWASQWNTDKEGKGLDHLVVVAGSLYLVADLYRLLQSNSI